MAKNDIMTKVGSWSFLIGILIALIFGLYHAYTLESSDATAFFLTDDGGMVAWVLAVLGTIIGLLTIFGKGTITRKEIPGYLFAAMALVIMGAVFNNTVVESVKPWIGSLLSGVSLSLSIFVAPTVGLLAIKAIWDMGKDV